MSIKIERLLSRAKKLQKRAGTVGFDWKDENKVIAKIDEEIAELKAELVSKDENKIQEEIGDIFFTLVNLCRHLGYEPEDIVKKSNNKFLNAIFILFCRKITLSPK